MSVLRLLPLVLILCCICISGCGKRHMQIDRDTRRMIDTTAARQINTLRNIADSTCLAKTDSMISAMTDSIIMERREEMRKLLGR